MAEGLENIVKALRDPTPGVNLKKFHTDLNKLNVSSTDVKEFLSSFKPANEFEKILKLKLIDKLKLHSELEKLFKDNDPQYIGGALRCAWFFEDIHWENVSDFFSNFFPYISYSTRLKAIHKYSKHMKNEEKCDKLYHLVKERYGMSVALDLLPACSEALIIQVLYTLRKPLKKAPSISLYLRHPKVFKDYLVSLLECRLSGKFMNASSNIHEYDEIFRILASVETDFFLELFDKYGQFFPWIKLGRGVTKKIVKRRFSVILKHANELNRFFNVKNLKKTISKNDMEALHLALLPKDLSTLKTILGHRYSDKECITILSDLKGTLAGEIFLTNFKKAYGKDLLETCDIIDYDLAAILPSETRCSWAAKKFGDADEINRKAEFAAYLEPDEALPILKELVKSQTEIHGRVHVVKCMFTCLKVNKAKSKVGEILSFITSRLRNDQANIREKVLDELTKDFDLAILSADDWKLIETLLNIISINREQDHLEYYIVQIIEKWIDYKIMCNMDADELLHKLCNMMSSYYKFDLCSGTTRAKTVLLWFVKNLPPKLNDKNRSSMTVNLFVRLCDWNKSYPSDKIEIPDWILKEVKSSLCEPSYHSRAIMDALKEDPDLMKTLVDEFFPNLCSPRILINKLKEDPCHISNDLEKIMNSVMKEDVKEYLPFFKKLKMYTHSGLSAKVVEICNANLHEGSGFRKTWNSIILLSYFVPAQTFIQIITPYYPKSSTIEDFSDGGHSVFDIQKQIALSLKNLSPPLEMLEPMRKFCTGDYLKLVVGSLYSLCLKCSENQILQHLVTWLDCPVSQRKHYLRAYCKVAPISDALNLLEKSFIVAKNTSLRVLIFDNIFKFFLEEPTEQILETLKHVVEAFSSDDHELLKKLYSVTLIPSNFFSQYIDMLWALNVDRPNKKKMRVISLINSNNIMHLTADRCDSIIGLLFSDEDEEFQPEVIRFCTDYILYGDVKLMPQSTRLTKVMEVFLKHNKNLSVYSFKRSSVFLHKSLLSSFLKSICRQSFYLPSVESRSNLLVQLTDYFKDDNLRAMFFRELLFLECSGELASKKQILDPNYVEFLMNKIVTCVNEIGGEILFLVVEVICDLVSLDSVSPHSKDSTYLKLSASMLKEGKSSSVHIAAVLLLPDRIAESSASEHMDLVNSLLCLNDSRVKVFVNEYLKKLSSNISV